MKEQLIEFYLDWINNYLSIDTLEESHGLTEEDARKILTIGMKYHNQK